jgi:hypothetical protein
MIVVVSGLPRSGTSLMMQMLAAGGLPVLSDGLRQSDENNPRGYYEWEKAKQLPQEPGCVAEAEGKAVKVISSLLFALPAGPDYRVLFMLRPIEEVVASQAAMIGRLGTKGPALDASMMAAALKAHLAQTTTWLDRQSHMKSHQVAYHKLLGEPLAQAEEVARFLDVPLDVAAMAAQVDASLYRSRAVRPGRR